MNEDVVRIWKFETAPDELRTLAPELARPRWIIQIPKSLYGPDLDAEIRLRAGTSPLVRQEDPQGDVLYYGVSELAPFMASILPSGDHLGEPPQG